jgi:Na+/H+ antiporter NhaD/arsenite permease-like protein
VLVEALSVQGWLTLFANGLGKACSQSLPAAVWIMGWLSVLLSNTINNQVSERVAL